ncbi:MurR/RpiR family transcriptional regulator [Anaerotignum sp. MB30-C6]|uniref:MurR/RpiR family transcriptional regulator n=1 Tax=Anaerotignum sp. MB30-C6 TaxID=3070814 RepID=UPI0027DC8F7C|nr:MurR/RpiR family transcriptional regulator [Anaerotignum sp. MB30-C6]WMI80392.1 MurR/RpiR family transcriptional regulator [Anaerotignum sp. MB30-C6]
MNVTKGNFDDNLKKRIRNSDLTKVQKKIGEYFVKNHKRIYNMTTMEIARELSVSDASIIRFTRAIGYEGFVDFKDRVYKNLIQEIYESKDGEESLSKRLELRSERYKNFDITREMIELMSNNVEQSLMQNDIKDYKSAVNMLKEAQRVFVVGLHGSKGCAVQFGRLLSHILEDVFVIINGDDEGILPLQMATEKDTVVVISFARYYKIDIMISDLIKRKTKNYVLITDSLLSPLAKDVKIVLLAETKHMSFFNSMLGAISILEYILNLLSWEDKELYGKKLKDRDSMLSELRF